MDPEAFTATFFKCDPRGVVQPQTRLIEHLAQPPAPLGTAGFPVVRPRDLGGLEQLFQDYGIRYYTAAKIAELGFTVNTLLDMRDSELDEMINSLSQVYRWELLVGERYGIKAAVRAERRRLEEEDLRRRHLLSGDATNAVDAFSQEGLSEEPVQQEKEAAGSGGGGTWEVTGVTTERKKQRRTKGRRKIVDVNLEDENDENEYGGGGGIERQREHPFIVTEPGEVARGKKNGLDYLFHLYEQCRDFLLQVQNIAKERGEKCPTKVNFNLDG